MDEWDWTTDEYDNRVRVGLTKHETDELERIRPLSDRLLEPQHRDRYQELWLRHGVAWARKIVADAKEVGNKR